MQHHPGLSCGEGSWGQAREYWGHWSEPQPLQRQRPPLPVLPVWDPCFGDRLGSALASGHVLVPLLYSYSKDYIPTFLALPAADLM